MDEEMCWAAEFLFPAAPAAQAVFGENRWMFLVKLGRNLTRVPHLNFREIWVTYYSRNGQDDLAGFILQLIAKANQSNLYR